MRLLAVGLAALLLLAALGGRALAEGPVTVTSAIDRAVVTAGDPILLSVSVDLETGWQVSDPGVPRALGGFEIIGTEPAVQTRLAGGVTRLVFRYRISAYAVGDHTVPPVAVAVSGPAGAAGTISTEPHTVRVQSVVLPGEDASDIKPLKPQLSVPGLLATELARWAFAALGALAVLGLVASVLWALRKRRVPTADGLTPAQRALAELEQLAAQGLPDKGRYSEHYERMADVLRRYLAEQYRLPARERTPRELRAEMERAGVEPQQRALIFELLGEAETVRFHTGRTYPAHARNALGSALETMKRAAAAEQYAVAAIRAEP